MRNGEGWISESVSFVGHGSCGQRGPVGASEELMDVSPKERDHVQHMSAQRMGSQNTTFPPNSQVRPVSFSFIHSLDLSHPFTCDPDEMTAANQMKSQ